MPLPLCSINHRYAQTKTQCRKHILPLIETFNRQIQVKLGRAEWASHRALVAITQHLRRIAFIFIQRTQACIVSQPWNIATNAELMKLDAINAYKSSNNFDKKFRRSIEKGAQWRGRNLLLYDCSFKWVCVWLCVILSMFYYEKYEIAFTLQLP